MGRTVAGQASEHWVIIGGSDESPALASDSDVETYLIDFALHSGESRAVLWLGGAPRVLKERLRSIQVFDALASDDGSLGDSVRASYGEATTIRLLLGAPLRLHRQQWWASGFHDGKPHHFDLYWLLRKLRPEPGRRYEVIVPAIRSWHGCPSAATVDVPDASTLARWQQDLSAAGLHQCRLVSSAGGHVPHRPETEAFRRALLAGATAPLEAIVDGFARLCPPSFDGDVPVYLLGFEHDPDRWRDCLRESLLALSVDVRLLRPGEPPSRALICVLDDGALANDAVIQSMLPNWRTCGAAIVLLDRARQPGKDLVRGWRLQPANRRGPWRPLGQALCLRRVLRPKTPPQAIDVELVIDRIHLAHHQFREQTGHFWNDAIGHEVAADLADLDERSPYKADILKRLEQLFSLVDGRQICREPESRSGLHPALSALLAAYHELERGPDEPVRALPASRFRPLAVRLTYSGNEAYCDAFTVLSAARHLSLVEPVALTEAMPELPACDVWLHAAETQAGLLPSDAKAQALARRIDVLELARGHELSCRDVVLKLRQMLDEWFRDHSLFVSYTRSDQAFAFALVAALVAALERSGLRCWLDRRDANGGYLKEALEGAINRSRVVLVVLSAEAVKRRWVLEEIGIALRLQQERAYQMLHPITLDSSDHWQHCEELYQIPRDRQILPHEFERGTGGPRFDEAVQRLVRSLTETSRVRPRLEWVQ